MAGNKRGTSVRGRRYYDIGTLLSRNGSLNFVVGPRGNGKTYGAKKWAINDFLKTGAQFIYLRRYAHELSRVSSFFDDVCQEFPEAEFRVVGHEAQLATSITADGKPEWRTCGFFIALSVAQQLKSVPFPDVTKIIYDEFILDSGFVRYIPDEVTKLLDFIVTVDRFREVGVRCVCLANSTSINNPYFAYFDIHVPDEGEFYRTMNGRVVAQFPSSTYFVESARQSDWGRLIDGSKYADYSLGNTFFDNTQLLLGKKGPDAICYFGIDNGQFALSCWNEPPPGTAIWTVEDGRPPVGVPCYTTDIMMVDRKRPLARGNEYPLQLLTRAYRQGSIRFDSQKSRNNFIRSVNM